MEPDIMRQRDALFTFLYRKITVLYLNVLPPRMRTLFEVSLLTSALLIGVLWWYVHWAYILYPDDCLAHVTQQRPLPSDTIIRVEAYTNSSHLWALRQRAALRRYRMLAGLGSQNDTVLLHDIIPGLSRGTAEGRLGMSVSRGNSSSFFGNTSGGTTMYTNSGSEDGSDVGEEEEEEEDGGETLQSEVEYFFGSYTLYELLDPYVLYFESPDYALVECAREPGFLSLTPSSRQRFNITVLRVYVDPDNSTCFGGPFGFLLTKLFFGYEMMIIASFKYLLPEGHNSAYVKDILRGSHYYYHVQWMSRWLYASGILPALFFTLVASILLRQFHFHFFKFITHFQQLLNQGVPMPVQTAAQIPFLVATYATIGLIIVMSEALGDDSLFCLLMVVTVWEVDQFYIIFCRHPISRKYFPWFFFIYHFLPYGYFVRFGGQFWFIPFLFHWLLVQHAMVFFLHHIELAAVPVGPRLAQVAGDGGRVQEPVGLLPPQNPNMAEINPNMAEINPNMAEEDDIHDNDTFGQGIDPLRPPAVALSGFGVPREVQEAAVYTIPPQEREHNQFDPTNFRPPQPPETAELRRRRLAALDNRSQFDGIPP